MHVNNGLKFSFSLLNPVPQSAHSTPKFPSIEIDKQMKPNRKRPILSSREQRNRISLSSSSNQNDQIIASNSKGKRILEKYAHLKLFNHNTQRSDKDCKSVRSAHSSNSHKYYRSKTETTYSLTKSTKNKHSVITATHLQTHIYAEVSKNKHKNSPKAYSRAQVHAEFIRRRLFQQKKAERITSAQTKRLDLRHSKTKQSFLINKGKDRLQQIPDKGKSFKSILHKARPILRIGNRLLNNSRLELMSKPLQIQDYNEY